jgi:hypothetical protein
MKNMDHIDGDKPDHTAEEIIHILNREYLGLIPNPLAKSVARAIIRQLETQIGQSNITLNLDNVKIGSISPIIKALQCPNITSLNFSNAHKSSYETSLNKKMASKFFEVLENNTTLKSLSLVVDEKQCLKISNALTNNRCLEGLTLYTFSKNSKLSYPGGGEAHVAKMLRSNTTLKFLNMPHAKQGAVVELVNALEGNKVLNTLGFNNVSNYMTRRTKGNFIVGESEVIEEHHHADNFFRGLRNTNITEVNGTIQKNTDANCQIINLSGMKIKCDRPLNKHDLEKINEQAAKSQLQRILKKNILKEPFKNGTVLQALDGLPKEIQTIIARKIVGKYSEDAVNRTTQNNSNRNL